MCIFYLIKSISRSFCWALKNFYWIDFYAFFQFARAVHAEMIRNKRQVQCALYLLLCSGILATTIGVVVLFIAPETDSTLGMRAVGGLFLAAGNFKISKIRSFCFCDWKVIEIWNFWLWWYFKLLDTVWITHLDRTLPLKVALKLFLSHL